MLGCVDAGAREESKAARGRIVVLRIGKLFVPLSPSQDVFLLSCKWLPIVDAPPVLLVFAQASAPMAPATAPAPAA